MKKTLLLSVVASTMIMAGGDIAPVEPVVEAPVEVSGWDFTGQAVLYYQTRDVWGDGSLFEQREDGGATRVGQSSANAGLQLGASNKDIFWGFGAGFELSGLGTLGLENEVVDNVMQTAQDGELNSAEFTQAYLTYGIGNTSIKVGRQLLPKSLSPFAFSEGWNVFKNTFDAALIVNTDITDTTLVGAYVHRSNSSLGNLGNFDELSAAAYFDADGDGFTDKVVGAAIADSGVWMLTAQNKSIENLTLTGSWYYAPEMVLGLDDVHVLWADAKYGFGEDMYGLVLGVQGGTTLLDTAGLEDTTAFGAKIGGNFNMFDASIAYSSVDDGTVSIENLGTNVKTPLYTQMVFNQNSIKRDSDTIVVRAGMKALGGKFGVAYGYSDLGATALDAVTYGKGITGSGEYSELDLTYKTKVFNDSTTLFAAYVYQDSTFDDVTVSDVSQNMLRFWARYNF